jgi:hypothetical protein
MTTKDKPLFLSSADGKMQINTVVNGCRIRLNFAPTPDGDRISDIKRMILSGLSNL